MAAPEVVGDETVRDFPRLYTQILCREALMFDKFGLVAAEFLHDVQVR